MPSAIHILWDLSPFILGFLLLRNTKQCKKQEMLIMHLFQQKRIDNIELHAAGLKTPPQIAPPQYVTASQPAEPEAASAQPALTVSESPQDAQAVSSAVAETIQPALQRPQEMPVPQAPQPVYPQPVYSPPKQSQPFSPISALLGVGVFLIIAAALIFVRSAWGVMRDPGKLLILMGGSALFFGTSALARKVWSLERTGTAFFTLGAVFLPISVWAAGFFHLLGNGLSMENPFALASLSFAAFTVIACIALKMFREKGWLIAGLSGLSLSVWSFAIAMGKAASDDCGKDTRWSTGLTCFLCIIGLFAVLLTFGCWLLREKLSESYAKIAFRYSFIMASLTAGCMLLSQTAQGSVILAVAVFLSMAAFCAPPVTEWLRDWSALPISVLGAIGFSKLLSPLCEISTLPYHHIVPYAYRALICIICALIWYAMLACKCIPDHMKKGSFFAAYGFTGLNAAFQFMAAGMSDLHVYHLIAAAVLLAVTVMFSGKTPPITIKWLVTAQALALCISVGTLCHPASYAMLLTGILALICLGVLYFTKRYRTGAGDIACVTLSAICAVWDSIDALEPVVWVGRAGTVLLLVCAVLFWLLTMEHGTSKASQYFTAVLTAVTLGTAFVFWDDVETITRLHTNMPLFWSYSALAAGTAVFLLSKQQFGHARKLLAGCLLIPSCIYAMVMPLQSVTDSRLTLLLTGSIITAILWLLSAKRGQNVLSGIACTFFTLITSAAAFFAAHSAFHDPAERIMNENTSSLIALIGSLPLLVCMLAVLLISKEMISFCGKTQLCGVTRVLAPLSAFALGSILHANECAELHTFFFLFTFGYVVISWLISKPRALILPFVSILALFQVLESVRQHLGLFRSTSAIPVIIFMCLLEALLPYLGKVLRETEPLHEGNRRSISLSLSGAIIPVWLAMIGLHLTTPYYPIHNAEWIGFFIPILTAGFIVHFIPEVRDTTKQKHLMTVVSALLLIACWIQPLFDVSNTYLEGKLHLLPLIGFGIVIRQLYGAEAGGKFLFGIGIYMMLRLTSEAIATEDPADLLTLLGTALAIFIGSFYVKQKKWFLLGGISLLLTAIYLHLRITHGAVWWVYLLLAGLLLIVIAAVNETLKQRGDSLKNKAGRLWDEWTW
ncbi:MAG TPA: hypothetical protein DCG49_01470 [Ruminococcus sp.]|nr:hypothetical protein [Ruminococcus sp.]